MKSIVKLALASVAAFAASGANATTVDFKTYAYGSSVSSIPGATVAMYGGPSGATTPTVNSFGTNYLGNSSTGDYPTSEGLVFTFSKAVKNLSFVFHNFGNNSFSPSQSLAFKGTTLFDSQNINSCEGCLVSVNGSGITSLRVNNGSGGQYSWEYGIESISFDAAGVPEPASWMTIILGFGVLGSVMRRRAAKRPGLIYA